MISPCALVHPNLPSRPVLPPPRPAAPCPVRFAYAPALDAAREHQRAEPKDPEGYKLAARALLAQGDPTAERNEIGRGLEVLPGSADLLQYLVAREIQNRNFEEAHRLANQVKPSTSRDLAIRYRLQAGILSAQSRIPEAIVEMEAATDAAPEDPYQLISWRSSVSESGILRRQSPRWNAQLLFPALPRSRSPSD